MIDVYDGNNVLMRALTDVGPHNRGGMNLRQRYHGLKPSDIWVFDGRGHNQRRQDIYPAYKAHRTPPAENIFAQINMFKDLLKLSPATLIEVDGWEADDVINTIARRGADVRIHTNDMDYGQIAWLPNVTLNGVKMKDVEPRWIPLYKALVGDPSDNIAGIPGFGPKSWAALAGQYERFQQATAAGQPHGFEAYLPKRVVSWLAVSENVEELRSMLLITHFFLVPEDELNAGIVRGSDNLPVADAMLTQFFL